MCIRHQNNISEHHVICSIRRNYLPVWIIYYYYYVPVVTQLLQYFHPGFIFFIRVFKLHTASSLIGRFSKHTFTVYNPLFQLLLSWRHNMIYCKIQHIFIAHIFCILVPEKVEHWWCLYIILVKMDDIKSSGFMNHFFRSRHNDWRSLHVYWCEV